MNFFDSHAHYNDERFIQNRDELIKKMYNDEITNIVCAGYSLKSSEDAINFTKKYHHIFATCGISPTDINDNVEKELEELEKIAKDPKCVAIGEIGLDYHWNKENKELQRKIFIEQIKMAERLDLPIVIHTREAVMDTIQILKEHCPKNKGVFHCCPLNQELIKEGLKLGFYISFSGNVTFKNSKNANLCIETVPIGRILIETDSPYMSPEPFRGTRNTPAHVRYVAEKIANVKQLDEEEIAKQTFENACRILKISK